jgi:hypothetical protein
VAVVAVGAFVGYLAIPFSGGGPTGLAFLIVSSLRYSMTAVLVGAVCWAAFAPGRAALAALGAVGAWNAWRLRTEIGDFRPDVQFSSKQLVAAIGVGVLVALALAVNTKWWPRVRDTLSRQWVAAAGAALVVVLLATGLAFHRYDRGRTPSPLESTLLAYGGEHSPVAVLGVLDLRSLLGPRLERPLVNLSRGGKVGEIPFADENQVRRLLLDETDRPPAPASFGPALDNALRIAAVDLLVVGSMGQASYPEGWAPDATWCALATASGVQVYGRVGSAPARACR